MVFSQKCVFIALLSLFFWQYSAGILAQEILRQDVNFKHTGEGTVGEALGELSEQHGFYFSYQHQVIPVEQAVTFSSYQGSLLGFLQQLLGEAYEFKELPGYVIIRYAPGILDLDVEIEVEPRQVFVKGFVRDKKTGQAVPFATVYDKDHLKSVLTNESGYFDFRTKSVHAIWLTLSKDQYKDTTFMILPPVEIEASRKKRLFRYYQEDGSAGEVEQSFFGRMFIGFRQRFQRINLGGFFAESPFQMSLTPGLSSQGMFNSQMINKFSINLLGGYTAGVDGFEAAGVFNINQKDVRYFQMAGAVNVVGGEARGFQAAGISNKVLKDFTGVQVAGLSNQTLQEVRGFQIAGIINQAGAEAGHQIGGLINRGHRVKGVQIAGVANWADENGGVQVAGILNKVSGTARHQVAGLINKAGNVQGVQLAGLINIAKSSDYPIGLLNFVEDGKKSLTLQIDESGLSSFAFRSGGRALYGLLGLGYGGRSSSVYAFEAGLGWYVVDRPAYSLDVELVSQFISDFGELSNNTSSIRILNGIKISPRLRFILGPTLNFSSIGKDETSHSNRLQLNKAINGSHTWLFELGATGGLQYVF
jgi:hypothetical protein